MIQWELCWAVLPSSCLLKWSRHTNGEKIWFLFARKWNQSNRLSSCFWTFLNTPSYLTVQFSPSHREAGWVIRWQIHSKSISFHSLNAGIHEIAKKSLELYPVFLSHFCPCLCPISLVVLVVDFSKPEEDFSEDWKKKKHFSEEDILTASKTPIT